jgi:peroxiredoxin
MKKVIYAVYICAISLSVQAQPTNFTLDIGNIAPEIKLANPQGNEIALTELKGKMVLISFWASWCSPCRRENINYAQAFNQFKNAQFRNANGFTIYCVSLDRHLNDWTTAIEEDKLVMYNNVSELSGWQSKTAKKYGVKSIPSNFLINAKGEIIAKNLKGDELLLFLNELLR